MARKNSAKVDSWIKETLQNNFIKIRVKSTLVLYLKYKTI